MCEMFTVEQQHALHRDLDSLLQEFSDSSESQQPSPPDQPPSYVNYHDDFSMVSPAGSSGGVQQEAVTHQFGYYVGSGHQDYDVGTDLTVAAKAGIAQVTPFQVRSKSAIAIEVQFVHTNGLEIDSFALFMYLFFHLSRLFFFLLLVQISLLKSS
jgi:hypothetical protein